MKIDKLTKKLDDLDLDMPISFSSTDMCTDDMDWKFLFVATILVEILREIKKLK